MRVYREEETSGKVAGEKRKHFRMLLECSKSYRKREKIEDCSQVS
jgi:hypothetical protein